MQYVILFFFSSRRRHTSCALVTGVQTCALPISNFKEAQTARIAPGQPVIIRVDALEGADIHGKVARIAQAAGNEFSIIKPDNATGPFVNVPHRITVRITPDPDCPLNARLRPAMSAEASVDTRAGPVPSDRTSVVSGKGMSVRIDVRGG